MQGLTHAKCVVHPDDIIVHGITGQKHLAAVLHQLTELGLRLKPEKFHLMQSQVNYLQHTIWAPGIHTDSKKVEQVELWLD